MTAVLYSQFAMFVSWDLCLMSTITHWEIQLDVKHLHLTILEISDLSTFNRYVKSFSIGPKKTQENINPLMVK